LNVSSHATEGLVARLRREAIGCHSWGTAHLLVPGFTDTGMIKPFIQKPRLRPGCPSRSPTPSWLDRKGRRLRTSCPSHWRSPRAAAFCTIPACLKTADKRKLSPTGWSTTQTYWPRSHSSQLPVLAWRSPNPTFSWMLRRLDCALDYRGAVRRRDARNPVAVMPDTQELRFATDAIAERHDQNRSEYRDALFDKLISFTNEVCDERLLAQHALRLDSGARIFTVPSCCS
jgi:hypothetical protein